jgi:hypothetical protein
MITLAGNGVLMKQNILIVALGAVLMLLGFMVPSIGRGKEPVAPPDCDNQCRERYVFFIPPPAGTQGNGWYRRYKYQTCEWCVTNNGRCLPNNDPLPGTLCGIPTGNEQTNRYYTVNSSLVCPRNDPGFVESAVVDPVGEPTVCAINTCNSRALVDFLSDS